MKEKEINKITKDAIKLRVKFREEYSEIAEEFSALCEKMDAFLADITGGE